MALSRSIVYWWYSGDDLDNDVYINLSLSYQYIPRSVNDWRRFGNDPFTVQKFQKQFKIRLDWLVKFNRPNLTSLFKQHKKEEKSDEISAIHYFSITDQCCRNRSYLSIMFSGYNITAFKNSASLNYSSSVERTHLFSSYTL